jgi:hypothetical protein
MTPEEKARQQIDALLQRCGWAVQDLSQVNLFASPGVAVREAAVETGEADYLLFAHGKAIAVVEAKPEGYSLAGVESQSAKYRQGVLDLYPAWAKPLPFDNFTTAAPIPPRSMNMNMRKWGVEMKREAAIHVRARKTIRAEVLAARPA